MFNNYKTAIAVALTAGAVTVATTDAHAARYKFGTDETLHAYAKTGMTHEKKPVALCYKTSTYNVIAPVHTTDEMVLCDVEKKMYWSVPTGERLKKLQAAGLMPRPLPAYERPLLDIMMGYLLWIVLAGVGMVAGASMLLKRKDEEQPETAQETAA